MQLYILAGEKYAKENKLQQYDIIAVIDEAQSVLWRKKYNDSGECEIYIPCNVEMAAILAKGNYVYRYDDDMFCKTKTFEIETDEENGDFIISTAKDICEILAGRIVRWQTTYSGTVGGFVKKLLTDNVVSPKLPDGQIHTSRQIPNFVIDFNENDFPEKIEVSVFADDLLERIKTTCKAYSLGFRVRYNMQAGKLAFKLYRGVNRASFASEGYVEFSPEFDNILSTHYKTDSSNFKNVVYVLYKNEAGETELLSRYKGQSKGLPEPAGESRQEFYIDGSNTSRSIALEELEQLFGTLSSGKLTREKYEKTAENSTDKVTGYIYYAGGNTVATSVISSKTEDGVQVTEESITITDYTYLLLIATIGDNALSEAVETEEFTGNVDTVDTYKIKVDYDLGDVVNVMNDYGIQAEARIIELLESDDNEDGYNIEPTFEFKN